MAYDSPRYFAVRYFNGIWPEPLTGEGNQFIYPSGISQGVSFGTARIGLEIVPNGILQDLLLGTPTIQLDIAPTGISQSTLLGTPTIQLDITPAGIVQSSLFGTPTIQLDITPEGIVQDVLLGIPTVALDTDIDIFANGILQNILLGSPTIRLEVLVDGILQNVTFGTPESFLHEIGRIRVRFDNTTPNVVHTTSVDPSKPSIEPVTETDFIITIPETTDIFVKSGEGATNIGITALKEPRTHIEEVVADQITSNAQSTNNDVQVEEVLTEISIRVHPIKPPRIKIKH